MRRARTRKAFAARAMSRSILITGSGARVGAHFATGLAGDGWDVAVHYNRSKAGALALAEQINEAGGKAAIVQANLAVPQEVDSLINRASAALGSPLTALINNASTFAPDTAATFTRASYDYHMEINLRAPLMLTQKLAQQLPTGDTGAIINMIDQRVLKPNPLFFTYSTAKSALFWATKTQAQSYAPRLRVNGIGPGPTLPNIHQQTGEFNAEAAATLLGRPSSADALLDGVRYLLNAHAVTGQMIAIDSGQHLTWQTPDLILD